MELSSTDVTSTGIVVVLTDLDVVVSMVVGSGGGGRMAAIFRLSAGVALVVAPVVAAVQMYEWRIQARVFGCWCVREFMLVCVCVLSRQVFVLGWC